MRKFRMYWFLALIVLSFTFDNVSAAKHEKKLPFAVVVGTVYCDTCFQSDFSRTSHFISGALVAVECRGTSSKPNFREEVKTNEHGVFKVHLPFAVAKHIKKIKACSVRLISSSEPYCAVASTATSSSLRLKSRKPGIHIFSAGFFTFKPLKQPTVCSQKPSIIHNSKEFNSMKSSTPAFVDPTFPPPRMPSYLPPENQFFLPPLPELPKLPPLPQLPPLPPLLGLPFSPPSAKNSVKSKSSKPIKTSKLSSGNVSEQQFFSPLQEMPLFPSPPPAFEIQLPPNPFQSPSMLPPNPFQPLPLTRPPNPLQTPPSLFPPYPFQPLRPLIFAPPMEDITPSPPPAFALPPFPFQPSPGFPGFPPEKKAFP